MRSSEVSAGVVDAIETLQTMDLPGVDPEALETLLELAEAGVGYCFDAIDGIDDGTVQYRELCTVTQPESATESQ